MAKRAVKTDKQAAARNPRTIEVERKPGEDDARALARKILGPTVGAALTANAFRPNGIAEQDLPSLVMELREQCEQASANNLGREEAMLVAQAHSLDAIFNRLAGRAAVNMAEHPQAMEIFLRMALRAQSQCRATIEALAAIKNPPVIYARQANIANGPQQINNGVTAGAADGARSSATHAGENGSEPNKLLEASGDGQRMDARTKGKAGRGN